MIQVGLEKLAALLEGRIPAKIDTRKLDNGREREFGDMVNQLIDFMREVHEFIVPLSQGQLHGIKIRSKNFLASPFKELHSRLLHLTWQAAQVAKGDYEQRIDFMGDFSEAFNSMIISLERNERLLKTKIGELQKALSHITKLEGILPICANCKKIRLENSDPANQDSWVQMEAYISKRTEVKFSHGICPQCMEKLYPELMDKTSL